MEKEKNPIGRLSGILHVVYGACLSLVVFKLVETSLVPVGGDVFKFIKSLNIQTLVPILIFLALIEDYCGVTLVNSIKSYHSSTRFVIDFSIVMLFFISFYSTSISIPRTRFIFAIFLIYFLSLCWAFGIRRRVKFDDSRTALAVRIAKNEKLKISDPQFPKFHQYLSLIKITNGVALVSISLYFIGKNILPNKKIFQENEIYTTELWVFLISFCLIQIIAIFWKLAAILKKGPGEGEIELLVKESHPIVSKFVVFVILVILEILKGIWRGTKGFLKEIGRIRKRIKKRFTQV